MDNARVSRRALPLASALLAAGLCLAAGLAPAFRDAEGWLTGRAALPLAAAAAAAIVALTGGGARRLAGGWAAWLVAGQAVALQLTAAGPHMRYQHRMGLWDAPPLEVLALGVYVAGVVAGAWRVRADLTAAARRLSPARLLALALLMGLTSATVSREVAFFAYELLLASALQLVHLLNAVLVVIAVPAADWTALSARIDRWLTTPARRYDRTALVCAALVTIAAAGLAVTSYERHPHVGDENAYVFHARILAEGRLSLDVPKVPEAFNLDLADYDADRWFASPPMGWPAVLAVGVRLGLGWLVNPFLGGLCVVLAALLLRDLYGPDVSRLSAVLMAVSPWHVFLAMTFMTHEAALALALTGALLASRARQTAGWRAVAAATGSGAAIAALGAVRPLEGAIMAAAVGPWLIGLGGRRLPLSALMAWVAAGALVGGLTLGYNQLMTGHPLTFPISVWADKYMGPNTNAMGFGPDRGVGWALDPYPGHSPLESFINSNLNITAINHELFGWASGSLAAIFALVLWGRFVGADLAMWGTIAVVAGAHAFYWYSGGPDFGGRYWYLMMVPLTALTARGLLGTRLEESGGTRIAARPLAVAAALSLAALVTFVPWRALDKYHHYLGMRADVRTLVESGRLGRGLVLVRGDRSPDWASAATYNPTDFTSDAPLFAWDGPGLREQLLAAYPDRPVWILDGPSVTGHGYAVTGPLSPEELRRLPPPQTEPDRYFRPSAPPAPAQ